MFDLHIGLFTYDNDWYRSQPFVLVRITVCIHDCHTSSMESTTSVSSLLKCCYVRYFIVLNMYYSVSKSLPNFRFYGAKLWFAMVVYGILSN